MGTSTTTTVITVEAIAGRWVVNGPDHVSIHDWRSVAVMAAEHLAARHGARIDILDGV